MMMPEMDGAELATTIRALPNYQHLPMVLLSSAVERHIARDTTLSGQPLFAAILNRPIKLNQLHTALVSVLNGVPLTHNKPLSLPGFDPTMSQHYPLRILVAEDNPVNQKVVVWQLGRMGYRADVVANGIEVLAALERQSYDVVLLDGQMPEMDGIEATTHIRTRWQTERTPWIIALTANALQGDRERFLAAGMDDYLSKPMRIDALVAALKRAHQHLMHLRSTPTEIQEQKETAMITAHPIPSTPDLRYLNNAPCCAILSAPADSIKRQILERLCLEFGEDAPQIIPEIIALFRESMGRLLPRMQRAAATGDTNTLHRESHALKGSSASIGAQALSTHAMHIEQCARAGEVAAIPALMQQLEAECTHVLAALAAIEEEMERALVVAVS
jgi:CheY-like chemotaxis protein/HPt (histidine-containing phosphotransfer) domain-containing protein